MVRDPSLRNMSKGLVNWTAQVLPKCHFPGTIQSLPQNGDASPLVDSKCCPKGKHGESIWVIPNSGQNKMGIALMTMTEMKHQLN